MSTQGPGTRCGRGHFRPHHRIRPPKIRRFPPSYSKLLLVPAASFNPFSAMASSSNAARKVSAAMPASRAICNDLGILDQRILADPKAPRYVLINGKLQNVPMGPGLLVLSISRWRHASSPFFAIFSAPATLRSPTNPSPISFAANSLPLSSIVSSGPSSPASTPAIRKSSVCAPRFPSSMKRKPQKAAILRGAFAVLKARKAKRGNTPARKAHAPDLPRRQ